MNIIVAYDGTLHAKKALAHGLELVAETGGEVTVIQIFDRRRFVDYEAGPGAETVARQEAANSLREAKQIVSERAVPIPVAYLSADGDAATILREHTEREPPDMLFLPSSYRAAVSSVSCPVYRVPGTVLVPIDGSDSRVSTERIVKEAKATGAKVLLLGIVPIHLFGKEEKTELAEATRDVETALRVAARTLKASGVETNARVAKGYPDEEIARVANEEQVSSILLPSGGATPSELAKAAAILLDESDKLPWPIFVVPVSHNA
jgi:nucleotide-binding universal stress UspA family protein